MISEREDHWTSGENDQGWISPEGKFHPIKGFSKGEIHADFAVKNKHLFPKEAFKGYPEGRATIDDQEELTNKIVKKGWIRKTAPDAYDVPPNLKNVHHIRGHFKKYHGRSEEVPMAILRVPGKSIHDNGTHHVLDVDTGKLSSFESVEGTNLSLAWLTERLHVFLCRTCEHTWVADQNLTDDAAKCHNCGGAAAVTEKKDKPLVIKTGEIQPRNPFVSAMHQRGGKGAMKDKRDRASRKDRQREKSDFKRGRFETVSDMVDALVDEDGIAQGLVGGFTKSLQAATDVLAGNRQTRPYDPSRSSTSGSPDSFGSSLRTTTRYGETPSPRAPSSNPPGFQRMSRMVGRVATPTSSHDPLDDMPRTPRIPRQFQSPKAGSSFSPKPTRTGNLKPTPEIYTSVAKAAAKYKVPTEIALGLTRQESGFNPKAVSSAGARGLTQIMPGALKDYNKTHGTNYSHDDMFDPDKNADVGMWYLSSRKGDWRDKAAAYYAGEGNRRAGYGYADSVLGHAGTYAARAKKYDTGAG